MGGRSSQDHIQALVINHPTSLLQAQQLVEQKLARFGAEEARSLYAMYARLGGDNESLAAAPAYALDADQAPHSIASHRAQHSIAQHSLA